MIHPGVQRVIDVLSKVEDADFSMMKRSKCIAGHCDSISTCEPLDLCSNVFMNVTGVSDQAIADAVVYPSFNNHFKEIERANVSQAIKMLEILRDTGKVEWDLALGLM